MVKDKFDIQEKQYEFPYHYLVNFKNYSNTKTLGWGGEYYSYMSETANEILKMKFENLIDVGCGDGKLLNILAEKIKNKEMVGIDLSEPSIYLAKGLNFQFKNIKFEIKDVGNIKKKYDIIVLNEVLEHISDEIYEEFCKKIQKIMHKNTKLIITVPTKVTPVQDKHYRHYDLNLIKKSFPQLEIKKVKYIFKKNIISTLLRSFSSRNLLPKKIELFIINKFLKKANYKNGKHLFVVLKK